MAIRTVIGDSGTVAKNPKSLVYTLAELVNDLAAAVNELKADHNAVLAKLDADTGLDESDYVSTCTVAAADVDTITLREIGTP